LEYVLFTIDIARDPQEPASGARAARGGLFNVVERASATLGAFLRTTSRVPTRRALLCGVEPRCRAHIASRAAGARCLPVRGVRSGST
jgi:hypothetical protein